MQIILASFVLDVFFGLTVSKFRVMFIFTLEASEHSINELKAENERLTILCYLISSRMKIETNRILFGQNKSHCDTENESLPVCYSIDY